MYPRPDAPSDTRVPVDLERPWSCRHALPLSLVSTAWIAAFLVGQPPLSLLAVPLAGLGALLVTRRPVAGSLLVAAAAWTTWFTGVSWGSVDMVLPAALVLPLLGRSAATWAAGAAAVVLIAVPNALRDGLDLGDLALTLVLFGAMWGVGRVVRHRRRAARAAMRRAALLAEEDPVERGLRRARHERIRLTRVALAELVASIAAMRTEAETAMMSLEEGSIRAINRRAVRSVDELRGLLRLLREPPAEGAEQAKEPPDGRPIPARWSDPAAAAALLATVALLCWIVPAALPMLTALYLPIAAGIAVRRSKPGVACLLAAVGTATLLPQAGTDPELLLPAAAAYSALTWAVVTSVRGAPGARRWIGAVGLGVLVVVALLSASAFGPTALGFIAAVFAISGLAAVEWGRHDARFARAEHERMLLQFRLDAVAAAALHAERLRLARELHDVAGHSVGAMVIQAAAAEALREKAPARARAALGTVVAVGARALDDVSAMQRALGSDEDDAPRPAVSPAAALLTLVREARSGGQAVEIDLGEAPAGAAEAEVSVQLVTEGLHNAQRHAPGATVRIRLRRDGEWFLVTVRDSGAAGAEAGSRAGAGFGLTGLAERVEHCGGVFRAGPEPGGGFLVEARLPATPHAPGPRGLGTRTWETLSEGGRTA